MDKLSTSEEFHTLDEAMQLTVRRNKRDYERGKRIPTEFYEEMVRESNISQKVWEDAKQKKDYALFCPYLQKMIAYRTKLAQYMEPDKQFSAFLHRF